MTEHSDSADNVTSEDSSFSQLQSDAQLKVCTRCGESILEKALKFKHCKRWVGGFIKDTSVTSYASLFVLGSQKKFLVSLASMAVFLLGLNTWVFATYSNQGGDQWLLKFNYSLLCILGNSLVFMATYALLILGFWGLLKFFQVPNTQSIARRARWTVIFLSTLIFSAQSYNLDELVSQQLFTITLKPPFQELPLQSIPHVLGVSSLDLMTLLYHAELKHQSTCIPLSAQGNHLVLNATIKSQGGTHRGRFLLDTGATHTILFKSFLTRNNLHLPLNTKRMNYQGLAGNSTAPLVYVDLTLGRIHVPNVLVMVVDDPPVFPGDGILGMNVLKQFRMDLNPADLKLTLSQ